MTLVHERTSQSEQRQQVAMIERKEDAESIRTEKGISIVNWRFANGWANDDVNSTGRYLRLIIFERCLVFDRQMTTWSDRESCYFSSEKHISRQVDIFLKAYELSQMSISNRRHMPGRACRPTLIQRLAIRNRVVGLTFSIFDFRKPLIFACFDETSLLPSCFSSMSWHTIPKYARHDQTFSIGSRSHFEKIRSDPIQMGRWTSAKSLALIHSFQTPMPPTIFNTLAFLSAHEDESQELSVLSSLCS
jgi:hypothetical protein